MHLDPWYYDFLFDGDHAATTTAQMRCGLSVEEVISLTTRPPDKSQAEPQFGPDQAPPTQNAQ